MAKMNNKRLTMDESATYPSHVQGCLDEVWSARLAGMVIKQDFSDSNNPIYAIHGKVRNQVALLGVLSGLYQMCSPILSVTLVAG